LSNKAARGDEDYDKSDKKTHKFESQDALLVTAVLFARVRVLKISAGYAQDRGPIQALKKKLNTQVLPRF